MVGCALPTCTGNTRKGDKLFRFPIGVRRQKWITNCDIEGWMPGPNSKLCQHHFEAHHFSTVVHARGKGLKPTAVPTKFIHNSNCEKLRSRHKKLPDKICIVRKYIKEEIETDDFFFNQRSIMGASEITHEHDTDIQTDTTNWIDENLKMAIELAPKTEPADQMENNLQVAVKVPRKRAPAKKRRSSRPRKPARGRDFLDFDFSGYNAYCTGCQDLEKEVEFLQLQLLASQQRVQELESKFLEA